MLRATNLHRSWQSLKFLSVMCLVTTLAGCGSLPLRNPLAQREPKPAQKTESKLLRQVDDRARAEACRAAAVELVRQGHEAAAIEQLERARRFDPKLAGVAHPLAVLHDREGHFSLAEREYALALEETPRDAKLLSDYGYFLYERSDLDGAETTLRKAIKADPNYQTASVNLGLVLAEQGRYDDAFATFESTLGPAAAHYNLGMVLARHGDDDRARREFAQALRIDPGLTQSSNALAWLDDAETTGSAVLPATWDDSDSSR